MKMFQYDSVGCFSLSLTSLNALATLIEVFLNIFLPTHAHTDMTALLYPCCACMRGVITDSTTAGQSITDVFGTLLHLDWELVEFRTIIAMKRTTLISFIFP